MKRLAIIIVCTCFFLNIPSGVSGKKREAKFQIVTEFGVIKIKLYNETPLHRDNFIKLTKEGFYTDLLFHRVIKNFMIQGGDPDSKNAEPGKLLGNGDLGYTIPAEFNPKFFHRRGVLAAAREGDQVNPEKRSSAAQFYLMQGRVFRNGELDSLQTKLENTRLMNLMQTKIKAIEPELNRLAAEGKQNEIGARIKAVREAVDIENKQLPPIRFTDEQRKAYTTIGGYPSLDNNYTIFGEVMEGMDVIDQIAQQPTDKNNRPLKDIRFTISKIKK
jgi:cyclophilin family peptidyl-prolyl cis-trans isomerase